MKTFDALVINHFAVARKISLGDAEKDYVLSAALARLADFKDFKKLGFKGGTCLRKAYYPDFRFSTDLDFSSKANQEEITHFIRENFEDKAVYGVIFKKVAALERKSGSTVLSLKYESQISDYKHVDSILFEASNSKIFLPLLEKTVINPPEFELPQTTAYCLQLEEILAEKIRAIYQRPKPRDAFDLAYLLEKGVKPDLELIQGKLGPLSITIEKSSLEARLLLHKERWRDLTQVLSTPPDFEETRKRIFEGLLNNGKLN